MCSAGTNLGQARRPQPDMQQPTKQVLDKAKRDRMRQQWCAVGKEDKVESQKPEMFHIVWISVI